MSDLLIALRTFVRLCEKPNFSRVAKELHASHTTVARRLAQLEAHFGAVLFHRTTRRLTATPEADRLLAPARPMPDPPKRTARASGPVVGEPGGLVRLRLPTPPDP